MTVGEDWVANHDTVIDGVELWFVGPQEAGFTPNVNVITQGIGTMTFEEYAELSVNSGPTVLPDFKLVTSGEAVGPGGSRLGVMEFTGTTNAGANALHFLAIWSIRDGQAIVATLTSPQDSFARLRAEVEPYMLTLRAI